MELECGLFGCFVALLALRIVCRRREGTEGKRDVLWKVPRLFRLVVLDCGYLGRWELTLSN